MPQYMSLAKLGIPALVGTGPVAIDPVDVVPPAATANRLPHVTVCTGFPYLMKEEEHFSVLCE